MPLSRQQSGVALLAVAFVALAGLCGLTIASLIYGREIVLVGLWFYVTLEATVIGVLFSEAVLLACWAAFRRNTATSWGGVLITLSVTLPFAGWHLFVPDERDGKTVLSLFLVAPLLLVNILPVVFASFDRSRFVRRLLWSLFWFVVVVTCELSVFAAMMILAVSDAGSFGLSEFRTYLLPSLLMIGFINIACFLVSMLSALWLRRSGYGFVATCSALEPVLVSKEMSNE